MEKNLLILGANGHGRVVKETAEAMNVFDKIEFLDDNSEMAIGKLNDILELSKEYRYTFVAIDNNELRMEWIQRVEALGYILPVLIHPKAIGSPSASVYPGTIIDHDSFIGYGTHVDCGAIVKSHCVILGNSKIESGVVVSRDELPSSEDFIKSKGF